MRRVVAEALFTTVIVLLFAACEGRSGPVGPSPTPVATAPTSVTFRPLGNFDVTFAADSACTGLPAHARTRTYTATLREGWSLTTLTGGTFPVAYPYGAWNVVPTTIAADTAKLWFQDPPIWESLANDAYVVIYGDAEGRFEGDTATLPFWAWFEYCPEREPDQYPKCAVPVITCFSQHHQLILQRR
jgi:hypothetical protein